MGKTLDSQIASLAKLGLTDAEIEQVLADDKRIDRGEKLFELDPELEKGAKKARQADRKPTTYNFQKRERKENTTKSGIIAELARFLEENSELSCENIQITNKERMIFFRCGGNDFEITLTQKRKPKN